MNERQAIDDIRLIQATLNRSKRWSCFQSLSVGMTGAVGLSAAYLDTQFFHSTERGIDVFVAYWFTVAAINCLIVGLELVTRYTQSNSGLMKGQTRITVLQLVPCLLMGIAATIVMLRVDPRFGTFLPGLWCMFLALGMLATLPHLPQVLLYPSLFYAITGCILWCYHDLVETHGSLFMGLTFGIGQIWVSYLLWERNRYE